MKVTVLQVRQTFGRILKKLQTTDEPIIIEKGRKPVAVLISIKCFKERFIDYRELKKRKELLNSFKESAVNASENSLKALRNLRYGQNH